MARLVLQNCKFDLVSLSTLLTTLTKMSQLFLLGNRIMPEIGLDHE
jgi:uncharacterized ferredoxin-like protein